MARLGSVRELARYAARRGGGEGASGSSLRNCTTSSSSSKKTYDKYPNPPETPKQVSPEELEEFSTFRAIGGKADLVLDLDTRLSFPTPASTYFSRTFLQLDVLRQQFGEVFLKVVEAKQYVREFSSDRSHMRLPDGQWQSPPPDYPCILAPDGVGRFEEQMSITSEDVARRREARGWGTVLTLEEFRDRFL